jgi:hypothetical protein
MLTLRIALNLGCRFQGTSPTPPNPGLKPWAILLDHFMVNSRIDKTSRSALPIPNQPDVSDFSTQQTNNPKPTTIVNPK